MSDREIMQCRATDLMRETLTLLDRLGADIAAVHVQWALDLVKEERVPTRCKVSKRTRR